MHSSRHDGVGANILPTDGRNWLRSNYTFTTIATFLFFTYRPSASNKYTFHRNFTQDSKSSPPRYGEAVASAMINFDRFRRTTFCFEFAGKWHTGSRMWLPIRYMRYHVSKVSTLDPAGSCWWRFTFLQCRGATEASIYNRSTAKHWQSKKLLVAKSFVSCKSLLVEFPVTIRRIVLVNRFE